MIALFDHHHRVIQVYFFERIIFGCNNNMLISTGVFIRKIMEIANKIILALVMQNATWKINLFFF